MSRKLRLDIVSQVAELENRLASLTFTQHGCIYFRDTLRDDTTTQPLITNPPIPSAIADRYALGQLTIPELWDGDLELDRGPWDNALAYIKAMGTNELEWARAFAKPRKLPYRATDDPESPENFISLLEQYLKVAPHLVPRAASTDILSPTLWHPDLHRDNVFVDPDTNRITSIIGWQSAAVAPLFLQSGVPRMFRHSKPVPEDWAVPERPDDYDSLSAEEKAKVDTDIESLMYHKYYRYQSLKQNPRHWACLEHQRLLQLRTSPVKIVTHSWKNNDMFYLREALMALVRRWDELNEDSRPCPISFSDEVYQVHAKEEANINSVGEILTMFRDQNLLPVDGMVDPVDFERVKKNCIKFKEIFVGLGETEEAKRLHARLWPYQDTDL